MKSRSSDRDALDMQVVEEVLQEWLQTLEMPLRRVLLVPPDGTRAHSLAGPIANILYRILQPAEVKILPALGTHVPMTQEEKERIFGADIPQKPTLTTAGERMLLG